MTADKFIVFTLFRNYQWKPAAYCLFSQKITLNTLRIIVQQANQPSTNVANFTDTDLQPVDMIPSKDPGNDFTTHGYSSLNLVCTHYSYNITILHVLKLDNNKIANKGHTMSCTFSESL